MLQKDMSVKTIDEKSQNIVNISTEISENFTCGSGQNLFQDSAFAPATLPDIGAEFAETMLASNSRRRNAFKKFWKVRSSALLKLQVFSGMRSTKRLAQKNFWKAKGRIFVRLQTILDDEKNSCLAHDYSVSRQRAFRELALVLWRPAARETRAVRNLLGRAPSKLEFFGHKQERKWLQKLEQQWVRYKKKSQSYLQRQKKYYFLASYLNTYGQNVRYGKLRWCRNQSLAFLSKYNLYNYFLVEPRVSAKSVSMPKRLTKQWTHKITIKMTSNNIFCTLVDQKVGGGKVLQEVSAGRYKIKITKKRLKHQYKPFLKMFFAKVWPKLGLGGLMVFITAPVRLRKKVISLLLKLRVYRLKSKTKIGRRAIFIKIHRKKCFNGCQSSKRRRKKRKAMRVLK